MSWVSDSTKNNQYAFQAADSQFEKNVNTPMVNKYQGEKESGKQRMAGDYLSDFTAKFSDNSKAKEVGTKDYRGDVRNSNVSSFLGNSAPKSVTQQKSENIVPNADQFGKDTIANQPAGIDYQGGYSNWTSDDWINAYEQNNDVGDGWNDEMVTTYADGRQEMSGSTRRTSVQQGYQNTLDQVKWLESYQGPKTWDEAFAPSTPTDQYKGNLENFNKYNTAVKAKDSLAKQYEEWGKKNKSTIQQPQKEMSSMPVGDPRKVKTKPANTSANQQKYTVDQVWDKYVQADRAQTGTTAEKNQGSIDGYWKAQDEIKSLRSQGLLIDNNGNVITG
jgi:hypothetical protein